MAELVDTVARRGVDEERVYGVGTAAVASAMAGEREGERSTSLAGRVERRGDEQVRGTHAVLAVEHLPACLAEPSSSLARQLGWASRWAG